MKNYNEMANNVLRRIGEYEEKRKEKRKTAIRIGTVAACFFVAAFVGITAWGNHFLPPAPAQTTETEASANTTNEQSGNSANNGSADIWQLPFNYAPDRNEVKVIASYSDGVNENDFCDTVPKDGEIVFSERLKNAMGEYGDSALYLATVEVFSNGVHLEADSPQVTAVREQLTKADYTVVYSSVSDGVSNHSFFYLYAKLNDLTKLEAYGNYGYRLTLY